MMKIRKLVALALILCVLSGLLILPASAETAQDHDTRWNIMLVVDGSGSLYSGHKPSDKEGLRYEALSMLIDSLHDSGNNVGAVVFNANYGRNTSWEAMYKGISLDEAPRPINSATDKQWLKRQIQNAPFSGNPGGDTDIGTAMLVAQQHLSKMDNGLKNAIFLFSDGEMDLHYPETEEKAYGHLATACENIRNEEIKVCGVFLNCNNSNSAEIRNIVYDCMTADSDLSELFLEINDASDLTNATDTFTKFLGYTMNPEIDIRERQYIRIPGVGVEEANIRIRTANGEDLPEKLEVIITRPDGSSLSKNELSAICSSGDTYRIYKLHEPECGTWGVEVKLPPDTDIDIKYRPILSINVDTGIEVNPVSADLRANDTAVVTTYLVKDGNRLTETACYREYSCILTMENKNNGEVTTLDIPADTSNPSLYTISIPLTEYTVYKVTTAFVCDGLVVTSPVETWITENTPPVCKESVFYSGKCGLTQENIHSLDLSDFPFYGIEDREDAFGELTITSNVGTVSYQAPYLTFDAQNVGVDEVILTITDTQGASCQMKLYLQIEDVTVKVILLCVTAVLLLLIILIVYIRTINNTRTSGMCTIIVGIPVGTTGNEKAISCTHLTPPGAQNGNRKMNLYDMLQKDMDDAIGSTAKSNCQKAGVSFMEVYKKTVDNIQAELSKATVSSVFYKDSETKKTSCNRIRFRYNKIDVILNSGDSTQISINNIKVTFLYSSKNIVVDDDPMGDSVPDFDDGFHVPGGFQDAPENKDPFGGSNSGDFGSSWGSEPAGGFDSWGNEPTGKASSGADSFGGGSASSGNDFGGDPFGSSSGSSDGGFGSTESSEDSGWASGNMDDISLDF